MGDATPQSLERHGKYVPLYHYFVAPFLLVYFLYSAYQAIAAFSFQTALNAVVALALLLVGFYARAFAIGVQDRLIRLEEQLRLGELCPDELRGRIGELSADQMVALRFASDEECVELARKVLDDPSMSRADIKRQIRHWRADHQRI